MKKVFMISVLLTLPSLMFTVHPEVARGAGFAKQSLFLSQSTVTEGQTVFIYAVVEDDTPDAFTGTLRFSDEGGSIGDAAVTLASGKATTVSVSWQPKAGTHTVTAALTSSGGTTVETEDAVFVVNSIPVPADGASTPANGATTGAAQASSTNTATTVGSSTPIINSIERISPQIAAKSVPAFNTLDSWRSVATNKLNQETDWSKANITNAATAPSGIQNTLWLILNTLILYFCSALAYAFANIGIFYPVLVCIFFYILWKMYRMFRR